MSNSTVTINGIPYRVSPYLSYGDYDNSCMVERANVRAVLEKWPGRVEMHANPGDYRDVGDVWTIQAPDTVDMEVWRTDWLRRSGPQDAILRRGNGWRDLDVSHFGTAFLPRERNAPRRVKCDKETARYAAFLAWLPFRHTSPGYRYGVATRAPYVLHGTGSHGHTYLWVRDDVKACTDTLDGLESYPSIDDELVSEMESDAENEWLESAYGGYYDVAQAMAKTLAAEYVLDVTDLDDVVTIARTRAMWSWEWLDSGPDRSDWRDGQLCFEHASSGPWIDTDAVAARFLAWDAFDNDPDGLHGLCARLVEWLAAAPSLDTPGETPAHPSGDHDRTAGASPDTDVDCDWGIRWGSPETGIQYGTPMGRARPCSDTDSGANP